MGLWKQYSLLLHLLPLVCVVEVSCTAPAPKEQGARGRCGRGAVGLWWCCRASLQQVLPFLKYGAKGGYTCKWCARVCVCVRMCCVGMWCDDACVLESSECSIHTSHWKMLVILTTCQYLLKQVYRFWLMALSVNSVQKEKRGDTNSP